MVLEFVDHLEKHFNKIVIFHQIWFKWPGYAENYIFMCIVSAGGIMNKTNRLSEN